MRTSRCAACVSRLGAFEAGTRIASRSRGVGGRRGAFGILVRTVLRKDKGTPMLGLSRVCVRVRSRQLALLRRVVPLSEAA